jgi:hypothetical protein
MVRQARQGCHVDDQYQLAQVVRMALFRVYIFWQKATNAQSFTTMPSEFGCRYCFAGQAGEKKVGATDQTLQALNEVRGQEKPDNVGLGEWIWGALQGDFNQERSVGQIGFDMVVSLIPIVDTLLDLRDLCANIWQYRKDPANKVTLFFIATTVIGFVPEVGTVVKSVLRIVWVYLKPLIKVAEDIKNNSKLVAAAQRACDDALPKITEYLQHNRVAKWATDGKLPDIYRFVAKILSEVTDKINPTMLANLLNDKFNDLKALLQKIRPIVPSTVREQIDDFLKFLDTHRRAIAEEIQELTQPVRTVLKVVAKRLDDYAWRVEVGRTNRAWIAPISESGSARLINAKPPKWAKKLSGPMEHPPLEMDEVAIDALLKAHPTHPRIDKDTIATFSKKGQLRADLITGPAKLYRIVDPSNEGGGVYWLSEAEFKALKNRDEWRSRFAVKPEWNQNGWVVEYEVKAGETLPIWRGPAASQQLKGTDRYLEGGGEQIVFYPTSRDKMIEAMPRVDPKTGVTVMDRVGAPDRRVEMTDVTGERIPTKLRLQITDSHIRGPIETGWGATDFPKQVAKRILLTAPAS